MRRNNDCSLTWSSIAIEHEKNLLKVMKKITKDTSTHKNKRLAQYLSSALHKIGASRCYVDFGTSTLVEAQVVDTL